MSAERATSRDWITAYVVGLLLSGPALLLHGRHRQVVDRWDWQQLFVSLEALPGAALGLAVSAPNRNAFALVMFLTNWIIYGFLAYLVMILLGRKA